MEEDPFTRKLHERERADEDIFFAKRDRELIEKLRDVDDETQRRHIRELAYMRCPECGARLVRAQHYGVTIEECAAGHGMWLTESELHALAEREKNSWIGRYFYRLKPVV
jgi:uncharacterized protein with PIN domain